jgi:zinc transporter ZupT
LISVEAPDASRSGKVAFAIWLGILIDGIPESFVIGTMAASKDGVRYNIMTCNKINW